MQLFKRFSCTIVILIGLYILGCASTFSSNGMEVKEGNFNRIIENVSTKQNVKALFGEPWATHIDNTTGKAYWVYIYNIQNGHSNMSFGFNSLGIVTLKQYDKSTGTNVITIYKTPGKGQGEE